MIIPKPPLQDTFRQNCPKVFALPDNRTCLMGVLNVTPDSFSDGGRFFSTKDAVDMGLRLKDEGADIVDVGGESTRPGAQPVSFEEEAQRVLPVIERLASFGVLISVDTRKPEVARLAISAGAVLVNDVGGFRLPQMIEVVAKHKAAACVMHMKGDPQTMQINPRYDNVVQEVRNFLLGQAQRLTAAGLTRDQIWLDPGIGFGKSLEHNIAILRGLKEIAACGHPVAVGVSRKSFIGIITGETEPLCRFPGSVAAALFAVQAGANILRVHDVAQTLQALRVWAELAGQ